MIVNLNGSGPLAFQRLANSGLKSTQQKMERQEKCASQVAFYENQKENLKNMKCSSLEEIAEKLRMFHSYEDQIAAAKKEYNYSQMMSVLDEARERGEKIAEAAEEMEPKTAEERRKEMQEEALGIEESKGILTEAMEEIAEAAEEAVEEILEEELEEITQEQEEAAELEEPADPEDMTVLEEAAYLEEKNKTENAQVYKETFLDSVLYQHFDHLA